MPDYSLTELGKDSTEGLVLPLPHIHACAGMQQADLCSHVHQPHSLGLGMLSDPQLPLPVGPSLGTTQPRPRATSSEPWIEQELWAS